jgi:NO-binding membrane sensor protein with MHYT domain
MMSNNMRMKEPSPEQAKLTQRFVGAIVVGLLIGAVALGLFAVSYGLPSDGRKITFDISSGVCLVLAIGTLVYAGITAGRIGRLSKK